MSKTKLPELEITLNGVTYDNTFENDVSIDRTDLDREFENQSRIHAYYGFLSEEAKFKVLRDKAELEVMYARLDHEKRQEAVMVQASNPKFKFTEKMCENSVISDSRHLEAEKVYHESKKMAGLLDVAVKSIAMRRDMLIQMGAASRIGVQPAISTAQETHVREIIAKSRKGE